MINTGRQTKGALMALNVKGLDATGRPFGVVTVTEFGAKGDGVTDDTDAIQKVLNLGGTTYFPPGTYSVTGLIAKPGSQLVGTRAAKITSARGTVLTAQSSVTVEGLTLESTYSPTGGCITINLAQNAQDVVIRNCMLLGASQAVNVNSTGVKNVTIRDNVFRGSVYAILTDAGATDVHNVKIIGNEFYGIIGDAVELNHPGVAYTAGSFFIISNNYFTAWEGAGTTAGFGIGIAGAYGVTIFGNTFEKCRGEAIHLEDECKHIAIIGNVIDGVGNAPGGPNDQLQSGIYCQQGDFISVVGNQVRNCKDFGIHFEYAANVYATNVSITGNTVTSCGRGGIRWACDGSANVVIADNIITGNTGDGLHLYGSGYPGLVKDNIIRGNTSYGVIFYSDKLGWVFRDNWIDGNTLGKFNTLQAGVVPKILSTDATAFSADSVASYTPWTNIHDLGRYAKGTLIISARRGPSYEQRMFDATWDGAALTQTSMFARSSGDVAGITLQMAGTNIQVRVNSNTAGTVDFVCRFEGVIIIGGV